MAKAVEAGGPADPLNIGTPPDIDMKSFADDLAGAVGRAASATTVGGTMADLYDAVGRKYGLDKHDFLRAALAAHRAGDVRLSGWPRMVDEIPDPELAPLVSSKIMWFAQPPSGTYGDDLAAMARRGDRTLNTPAGAKSEHALAANKPTTNPTIQTSPLDQPSPAGYTSGGVAGTTPAAEPEGPKMTETKEPRPIATKTASGAAVSLSPRDGKVGIEIDHPTLGRVATTANGWVPPAGKTPGGVWAYADVGGKSQKMLLPVPKADWDAAKAAADAHAAALDADVASAAPAGTVPVRSALATDGRMTHSYFTLDGKEVGTVGGDDHLLYAKNRGITYLPEGVFKSEAARSDAKRAAEEAASARRKAKENDALAKAKETNAEVVIDTRVEGDDGDDHVITARIATPDGRVITRRAM